MKSNKEGPTVRDWMICVAQVMPRPGKKSRVEIAWVKGLKACFTITQPGRPDTTWIGELVHTPNIYPLIPKETVKHENSNNNR